jgi:endo-1,4-beta-D-glucanase Y
MSSLSQHAGRMALGSALLNASWLVASACAGNGGAAGQGGASSGGATSGGASGSSPGSGGSSSGGAPTSSGGSSRGGAGGALGASGGAGSGSSTGGAPALGGSAGTPATGGDGGTVGGSGGAPATGGAGAASSGAAGAAPWSAAVASGISATMLSQEYAAWKTAHAQACADGSWVVKKDAGSVVSEGIAYGMLLAANFDDRSLFDGFWKYYTNHADPNGLMNWATGVCDPAGNNDANAATDGDLDAAMALLQAHARWPDGGYLGQAKTLTAKIIEFETELCDGKAVLRPGDKFGGCSDTSNQKINPSYFAPGYYRVFARYFPEQAARWNALVDGSYELFVVYQARMSGLVPDWSKYDGSDWYGSGYSYDACRTPWRVMVDYAWSAEPRAKTFLTNVNGWVEAHSLTGTQPNNSAFVGGLTLSAAYDKALLDTRVSAWLGSGGDDKPYFQGTLRVLYLLAAAGKFPSTL